MNYAEVAAQPGPPRRPSTVPRPPPPASAPAEIVDDDSDSSDGETRVLPSQATIEVTPSGSVQIAKKRAKTTRPARPKPEMVDVRMLSPMEFFKYVPPGGNVNLRPYVERAHREMSYLAQLVVLYRKDDKERATAFFDQHYGQARVDYSVPLENYFH